MTAFVTISWIFASASSAVYILAVPGMSFSVVALQSSGKAAARAMQDAFTADLIALILAFRTAIESPSAASSGSFVGSRSLKEFSTTSPTVSVQLPNSSFTARRRRLVPVSSMTDDTGIAAVLTEPGTDIGYGRTVSSPPPRGVGLPWASVAHTWYVPSPARSSIPGSTYARPPSPTSTSKAPPEGDVSDIRVSVTSSGIPTTTRWAEPNSPTVTFWSGMSRRSGRSLIIVCAMFFIFTPRIQGQRPRGWE